MFDDLNQCTFSGRLGGDPEVRYTGNGTAVLNGAIGVSRSYKPSGGDRVRETTWVRFVMFGKRAELAAEHLNLKKGDRVFLVGEYRTRDYEKNGEKRTSHEFHVSDIWQSADSSGKVNKPDAPSPSPGDFDDDVPF